MWVVFNIVYSMLDMLPCFCILLWLHKSQKPSLEKQNQLSWLYLGFLKAYLVVYLGFLLFRCQDDILECTFYVSDPALLPRAMSEWMLAVYIIKCENTGFMFGPLLLFLLYCLCLCYFYVFVLYSLLHNTNITFLVCKKIKMQKKRQLCTTYVCQGFLYYLDKPNETCELHAYKYRNSVVFKN